VQVSTTSKQVLALQRAATSASTSNRGTSVENTKAGASVSISNRGVGVNPAVAAASLSSSNGGASKI